MDYQILHFTADGLVSQSFIHNVNVSNENKQLTQFANSAKQFLSDGNISLTLMSHMKLYE